MTPFVTTYNTLLSIGSIIAMVLAIVNLIILFSGTAKKYQAFLSKNILLIGFLITLAGLAGSLIYSNVIGYPPCMFCWYARIFLYPQVFMFGYALFKKDRAILPYTLILTIAGILITGYHYFFIDLGHLDLIPCAAQGVSCSIRYVYEFGFVTIPFMGLASFLLLLSTLGIALKNKTY